MYIVMHEYQQTCNHSYVIFSLCLPLNPLFDPLVFPTKIKKEESFATEEKKQVTQQGLNQIFCSIAKNNTMQSQSFCALKTQ